MNILIDRQVVGRLSDSYQIQRQKGKETDKQTRRQTGRRQGTRQAGSQAGRQIDTYSPYEALPHLVTSLLFDKKPVDQMIWRQFFFVSFVKKQKMSLKSLSGYSVE
jgi:hypothetical protein